MPEAENTQKPDPVVDVKPDSSEELIGGKKFSELDPDTQAKIKELREENKQRRLKETELANKLAAIEADKAKQEQEAKAAQEKALQEQGDYKKLYEAATPQLEEIKGVKKRVTELESFVTSLLEARMKAIPENRRSLVEALPQMDNLTKLKWIEANASILTLPTAPNLDAGQAATKVGTVSNPQALEEMHNDYQRKFF